jgi:PAS domain S-box-containing protein
MAERHLASVVESANDLVISTDSEGCITSWNSAAERISGYASSVVRGQLLAGLCEVNRSKDMAAIIDQMVIGGVVEFFSEINLLSATGALIPVDWSFSPIRDDSGQVSGIVAVGRDLVERRALEQHLYQSEKLAALGVMAGGIAHELRNPLSVSFSAAQFLLDPIDDPAFQKECVSKILQGIERSSMIIENLLRFARPPSSNQAESLNLVTVVRETLSVLTPQAKVQKVNLIEHDAETVLLISGNANLLQQVIMNLVLNAYQALPGGGDVSVFTRREGDQAAVYVRDTGCGIASAHLSQIFDPFFTTRPVGQGTGLGLSICHTIVKQHGGVIAVENSVEGQGSTLVVRLPLMVSV